MDVMAIGAMSIAMHQSQIQQAANLSVMRKAMDLQESQAASLIEGFEQANVAPPSTHQLDILA